MDIEEYDFQKDSLGNNISFFNKQRIFLSLKSYEKEKNEGTDKINNIRKNKKILSELSENSIGIRRANNDEIKELSERIKVNRRSHILPLIYALFYMPILTIILIIIMFPKDLIYPVGWLVVCSSVLFVFLEIIASLCKYRVRDDNDVIYLIMECTICEKNKYDRRRYEIRCKDVNELYIDDWFKCYSGTYMNQKANIVIAKERKGRVYINSFDVLWNYYAHTFKV